MQIALKLAAEAKPAPAQRTLKEQPPFVVDALSSALANHAPAAIGPSRRLLIVDDNPVVLKAFALRLRASGFTVTTILDAAAVASAAEESATELIILDVNFPGHENSDWNGYTSVKWLQRFPKLAGIPVILISGEDVKQNQAKALAAGAVAFFQKPVPYPELLATIALALGIKK